MDGSHKDHGTRGSSILAGIIFVAMFGSAAITVESINPFASDLQQFAASSLAQAGAAVTTPEASKLVDDIPSWTSSTVPPYTAYYACTQGGKLSQVREFVQKCQPGFFYTVAENKDGITVIPSRYPSDSSTLCPSGAPDSGKKCSDPSNPEPVESCPTGVPKPCAVHYCIAVPITTTNPTGQKCKPAGKEVLPGGEFDIGEKRVTGLSEVLKSEDAGGRADVLSGTAGLSAPEQNILNEALGEEQQEIQNQVVKNTTAMDDIQKLIDTCSTDISVCGNNVELNALKADQAELERENVELNKQIAGLGATKVMLSGGEAPATGGFDLDPAETPSGYASRGERGGDGTTFPDTPSVVSPGGTSESDKNESASSFWSSVMNAPSAFAKKVTDGIGSAYEYAKEQVARVGDEVSAAYESAKERMTLSDTYDQARSNATETARLNGLAARTLYDELQKNPKPEVRQAADEIVASAEGDTGKQASFLSTLAETSKDNPAVPGALNSPVGLAALSAVDQQKLGIQEAIIEAKQCAPGSKSILDCFKAANLPYTLKGRTEVANALGLDCGKVGTASANVCMFKEVQNFNQAGTLTNTSLNRVVTVDPDGKILSDKIEEVTSTETVVAPSLSAGGTPEQLAAYKKSLENGGIVKTGDTVYKVELPVMVACIDSFGESVSNPACNKAYSGTGEGITLQSKSLPGLLNQIQDTEESAAATKYVLVDQTKTMDVDGSVKWTVDGGAGEYNAALLQRKVVEATEANRTITDIAVSYDQLPKPVRDQFVPTVGATQAPTVADTNAASDSRSPIERGSLEPPYDQERVNATETARLNGLAEEASRNEFTNTIDSALEQARAREEAQRIQAAQQLSREIAEDNALAAYAAAQAERQVQINTAASERLYGQANKYMLQSIDDALLGSGKYSPTTASTYIEQLTARTQDISTQADTYKYLQGAYDGIVTDGTAYVEAKLAEYGAQQLASGPSPSVGEVQLASQPAEQTSTPAPWWEGARQRMADLISVFTGEEETFLGPVSKVGENPETSGIAITTPQPSRSIDFSIADPDVPAAIDFSIADPDLAPNPFAQALEANNRSSVSLSSLPSPQVSPPQQLPKIPDNFIGIDLDTTNNNAEVTRSGSAFTCWWIGGCTQTVPIYSSSALTTLRERGVQNIYVRDGVVQVTLKNGSYALPYIPVPKAGADTEDFLEGVLTPPFE